MRWLVWVMMVACTGGKAGDSAPPMETGDTDVDTDADTDVDTDTDTDVDTDTHVDTEDTADTEETDTEDTFVPCEAPLPTLVDAYVRCCAITEYEPDDIWYTDIEIDLPEGPPRAEEVAIVYSLKGQLAEELPPGRYDEADHQYVVQGYHYLTFCGDQYSLRVSLTDACGQDVEFLVDVNYVSYC